MAAHPVHIVLIGRCGQGKSYLGNLCLGVKNRKDRIFPVGDGSLHSCTSDCSQVTVTFEGLTYVIHDSPGFPDSSDVDDPERKVAFVVYLSNENTLLPYPFISRESWLQKGMTSWSTY